jgi:hypothetical protein
MRISIRNNYHHIQEHLMVENQQLNQRRFYY